MKITADQYLVKKINKSLVLDLIRHQSPISKPQLEAASGLNKGTISRLVNELADSKLINEVGSGKSTGGRKPSMYSLNTQAGYALGMEIKTDSISSAVADLSGYIIKETTKTLNTLSYDDVFHEITCSIQEMINDVPDSPIGITGLGIAFPGLIDDYGDIMTAPSFKWYDIPFKRELLKQYEFPIHVENDARLGLIGEKKLGKANHSSNILYVKIGKSIGSGIIINNNLLRGSTGFSGQAGHLSILSDGIECVCGNRGCWQLYASTKAIVDTALKIDEIKDKLSASASPLKYLIEQAEQNNKDVIQIFNQTGDFIGIGLVNLINLLNPEIVIIAGEITDAKEWILDCMLSTIERRSLHSRNQNINISFSELGQNASLLGSISFALQHYFDSDKVPL